MSNLTVAPILEYAEKIGASDIHITEWKPLIFRISWQLIIKTEAWKIDSIKVRQILLELLKEDKELVKSFLEKKDYDFAYVFENWTSFRVNAFFKMWKLSFVLRRIASKVVSMSDLWLPAAVEVFTELKQWLILVTWPTGSGKSTTMVSILDTINKTRSEHILTIEDPIEFIFTDDKSIFSQREIGRDTLAFKNALRASLREDPDIIMIWEMRDEETVRTALELAETWHLVISTLHTAGSVQTITRLLSFFSADEQWNIKDKLADNLKWVLSQRLIQKKDWTWRIGIFELMFVTSGIKNLIRTWTLNQIQWNIETGSKYGMVTMQKYADDLRDTWAIDEKEYIRFFVEDADMKKAE